MLRRHRRVAVSGPERERKLIREFDTEVDGLHVRYLTAGTSGSDVLLLHGASPDCASLSWRESILELSERHRVLAVDLPGHGRSGKPELAYSTDYYVGFLERFMDNVGLKRASLIGLSMGGAVSLGYSIENAERVDKLVLVDSHGLRNRPPLPGVSHLLTRVRPIARTYSALLRNRGFLKWGLGRFVCGSPAHVSEELVDEVLAQVRNPDTARVSTAIREAEVGPGGTRADYFERLSEVRVPTLIVHGQKDKLIPVSCAMDAPREMPDSRLKIFEDCGHWPPRELSEEFNRVVSRFLEETRAYSQT